jgi:hypothetical protein
VPVNHSPPLKILSLSSFCLEENIKAFTTLICLNIPCIHNFHCFRIDFSIVLGDGEQPVNLVGRMSSKNDISLSLG